MEDIKNDIEQKCFELATELIFCQEKANKMLKFAEKNNITKERAKEIWQLAKDGLLNLEN